MKNNFKVIGLMSGTSLDGLDIACCHFSKMKNGWSYNIEKAITLKYPPAWLHKLSTAQNLSAEALVELDVAYGKFLGKACADFIQQHNLKVEFIASHGHTIFHQPRKSFTFQLGNGSALSVAAGLPVVYDFRSLDVLLGGEGAPLVPVGDKLLFHTYDVCLNLGGIANLSMDVRQQRVAYDICFCNMGLNYLMEKVNKRFDKGGDLASSGTVNTTLLRQLDKVYGRMRNSRPSLGRELFEKHIQPLLDRDDIPLPDKLSTSVESSAIEISKALAAKKNPSVLCTGGGAFNTFFMARLLEHCQDNAMLIIPENDVVKFKEALVFAFLGALRIQGKVNCLQSVTGASRNSSSGVMVGF